MNKYLLISLIFFLGLAGSKAQSGQKIRLFAGIVNGDTLPYITLKEVNILQFKHLTSKRQMRRTTRLIRYVKKVYPFAKLAGKNLEEYAEILSKMDKTSDRRKLMKQLEKEIQEEYGEDLKKLTFSQGKILIKLIDRETGNSSFKLVQELRGKFVAFFWQSFARLFGYNLKETYDPKGKDRMIETIVVMIENGQI
jgi:uncharacterized protein DUF4294